jgi:type II secretory ATPase GspE/PulE/Tfp pilus assembly ATPase PilB-like protein
MAETLRALLLLQPDVVVAPDLLQSEVFEALVAVAAAGDRTMIAKVNADSAAAALLMHYAKASNKQMFLKAVTAVTCQRLIRRLCDHCKQPIAVKPEAIQKLGGDPRQQNTIYNYFQLPPPEQRVDEKGQPVEMFPCPVCQGIGFIGRIAILELILVDDGLRTLIMKQPQVDKLEQYGRSKSQLSLLQQAYRMVLAGVTSMSEVQRVFSKGQG